jgi:hypothetical protein
MAVTNTNLQSTTFYFTEDIDSIKHSVELKLCLHFGLGVNFQWENISKPLSAYKIKGVYSPWVSTRFLKISVGGIDTACGTIYELYKVDKNT